LVKSQKIELKDSINKIYDSNKISKLPSPRKIKLIEDPLTPSKAAFYSAVLPGLGQAFIGKAWKIPIVYGAIGASIYYYKTNNKEMLKYRNAYKDRINGIYEDEYLDIIPKNETLLKGMKFHKSYRDISVICIIGFYMLNILDANVSAHMMQFNVSEDLTLNPKFIIDKNNSGIALSIKLN
tara:strand:+ start:795 stop:1337 length:543 start_codon:yes stop_codon:yes gene_type:complete